MSLYSYSIVPHGNAHFDIRLQTEDGVSTFKVRGPVADAEKSAERIAAAYRKAAINDRREPVAARQAPTHAAPALANTELDAVFGIGAFSAEAKTRDLTTTNYNPATGAQTFGSRQ